MGVPKAARTVEEILEEVRQLPQPEQVRLLRLLQRELTPGHPSLLWDDFEDRDVDKAYGSDEP